jgi:hypothetical protein
MNADKIEDLRMLSRSLKGQSWAAHWVRLTLEAADELERLGKIEEAAKRWRDAPTESGFCWIEGVDGVRYVMSLGGEWRYLMRGGNQYTKLNNRRVCQIGGRPE